MGRSTPWRAVRPNTQRWRVPALKSVVLVDHVKPAIVVWTRSQGDDWQSEAYGPGAVIAFEFVGAKISLDAVYAAAANA